ncbi:MAG: hypothetical protein ACRCU6_04050 [Fusobacteriaceae bacterium]
MAAFNFPGLEDLLDAANTISKARKANINEVVFQEILETTDFTKEHSIATGVESGDMVPVMEKTKQWGFLKKSDIAAGCNFNECTISDKATHSFWNPAKYDCEIILCLTDPGFTRDFRAFWNINCDKYDGDVDNVLVAYLVERVKEHQNESLWRIAYFDFKSNPSTDYAGIDGLFIQWQAIATLTNTDQRVHITENDELTFVDQMNLVADAGRNYFKAMYDKMMTKRSHMRRKVGLKFETTRDLAVNYLHWLQEEKETNCCFNMNHDGSTSSGYSLENLNYMGIPIVIREEWTEVIEFLTAPTATAYDKPHRAVLTYDGNKSIGTCDENKLKEFKIILDEVTEKVHIRVKTTVDAKVPLEKDFILAI